MKSKSKLLFLLILIVIKVQAQERITVAIGKTGTYIESYDKNSFNDEFRLKSAYRLGSNTLKVLKDGIKTSIKWIELNNIHNKAFEKEICRFKAMEKETFKFHGYVDGFATEMTMSFKGESDGSFKIEIKPYNNFSTFIIFTELYMVESFKDLLDGKLAKNEIDDIFKK